MFSSFCLLKYCYKLKDKDKFLYLAVLAITKEYNKDSRMQISKISNLPSVHNNNNT